MIRRPPRSPLFPSTTLFRSAQSPPSYRGSLFVAYHGSWNRTVPTGYKIVRVPFRDGRPSGPVEDFATGWLQGGRVLGRPVGLQAGAHRALYLSTDDPIYPVHQRLP